MVFRAGVVISILVLTGCSTDLFDRDSKALDKFSHADTDFQNTAYDAEISTHLLAANEDPFSFWKELAGALDVRGTDSTRIEHATTATSLHGLAITKAMEQFGTNIDKMDKSVLHLVEIANSIHKAEYRADAMEAAKAAREVHAAFWSVYNFWQKRLQVQIDVLRDIVLAGGQLRVTPLFRRRGEEANAITADIEAAAQRSSEAARKLRETFSALKGKSKMKGYPTKEEIDEQKQKDQNR